MNDDFAPQVLFIVINGGKISKYWFIITFFIKFIFADFNFYLKIWKENLYS